MISYCTTHLSKRSIRNAKAENGGSIIWLVSPAACWQNADMKTIVLEEPGRLLVTETDPPLKGATASASPKPATLATGVVIKVPQFVESGETIRVDPVEGRYVERAR